MVHTGHGSHEVASVVHTGHGSHELASVVHTGHGSCVAQTGHSVAVGHAVPVGSVVLSEQYYNICIIIILNILV